MNTRFIAMASSDGIFGSFGVGATIAEAKETLRKCSNGEVRRSGGTVVPKKGARMVIYKFESELPFAPSDRDANEDEADAWVGRDGFTNWIRCEREEVERIVN